MSDPIPVSPLNTKQAAAYCGVSQSPLEHLRTKGGGPEYEKPTPGCVRYTVAVLDAWRATKRFKHTAEYAARAEGGADVAA